MTATPTPKRAPHKGKSYAVLPGLRITLGFTIGYLSLLVLIPLSAVVLKSLELSWGGFWATVFDARVLAAYRISFATALAAGLINVVFGFIVAWVLVRYSFPGKRLLDGIIDLPFALPTAVAGIALTSIYAENGWIGRWLYAIGIPSAYSAAGIAIALTFIGLPFVVRTVQPVLEAWETDVEEAAATLGAKRLTVFRRIIVPQLLPSLLTGFALAFARGIGEYGSVVFISGNMPYQTEIAPLLIMTKLEQYDYAGATAVALVMLILSFLLQLLINALQWKAARRMTSP
ncbi:sulfate ABC transporter permease subunit CysT [Paenibacillus apiarius]|uniref:Sulfate transport system permease protein CysT n=1 Tax=Paenibacillus apiarius TaxID=46240 RepID=A0ABT4DV89_9BACL|nr:sulfate ABC transporter permease subunit CysT [Paenibacillus apiarius]MBN3527002.1 sulfate ABC transporter permease subunit CysT [Paenibacillus apiarius]MCY9514861.1 sulfate ABC transporter permease subunit CysT [Paenibacillus apiarius]MCY9521259.1 sulfate ABC transporter permease subunit CysT [Paenibacillus apiarius]MCY9553975.1 sulfate ABC transporter permease subunit CysT [Paenibacillus apiarius]MCY9560349.1 sulfate ABC transporter permease subunit CysT [Paenibacillus apiarius]